MLLYISNNFIYPNVQFFDIVKMNTYLFLIYNYIYMSCTLYLACISAAEKQEFSHLGIGSDRIGSDLVSSRLCELAFSIAGGAIKIS